MSRVVALVSVVLLSVSVCFLTGCRKDSTPVAKGTDDKPSKIEEAKSQAGLYGPKPQPNDPPSSSGVASSDADRILRETIAAYRQAKSYRDNAIVRVSYKIDGQTFDDTAPLSVTLQRPNRLRLAGYRTEVVCDGETLFAKITDESTGNIDNQIVSRAAPPKLHLQDIYGDALLAQVIGSGLARFPVQLELLLDENPLASALSGEASRKLLSASTADGQMCDRVAVTSPEGAYTFWIDQRSRLLRRLEYPTGPMQPEVEVQQEVTDLSLVVEFRNATFGDQPAADAFAFTVPADAKEVRYFVPPPQPLPTDLFGQQPGEFEFTTLGGETASAESLKGKTAVLLWFNNHPAGQASATALSKVAEQFADNDQVEFLGVCTEPSSVTDLQLENLMRVWRVDLPIARDLSATGRDVFQIPVWPTLVVLDAQGRVQLFECTKRCRACCGTLPPARTWPSIFSLPTRPNSINMTATWRPPPARASRRWSRFRRRRLRREASRIRMRCRKCGQTRRSNRREIW